MRSYLRVGFIALLALVIGGSIWSAVNSANRTGSQSNISTHVVVDFGEDSHRQIAEVSINHLPADITGWQALAAAKFKVQGTDQFPNGFVCRINGWPTQEAEDCENTPAFNKGHWSYYVTNSKMDDGWVLSGQGAAAHVPECCGYEGWSWVAGGREPTPPRVSPKPVNCAK